MSKNSRRISWEEAGGYVQAIYEAAERAGLTRSHVVVAGSFRRECQEVGDLDLVIDGRQLGQFMFEVVKLVERGEDLCIRKADGMITGFYIRGTRVEFYVTGDATEFGAKLLYATGSKEFNIATRNAAIRAGTKLNDKGVWVPDCEATPIQDKKVEFKGKKYPCLQRDGDWVKIAGRTEKECLEAIGMEYVYPKQR